MLGLFAKMGAVLGVGAVVLYGVWMLVMWGVFALTGVYFG